MDVFPHTRNKREKYVNGEAILSFAFNGFCHFSWYSKCFKCVLSWILFKSKKKLYSYFHQLSCMCVWKVGWLCVCELNICCVHFFPSVVYVNVLNCHQRDCQLITLYTTWMNERTKKTERCKRKYDGRNDREETVLSLDGRENCGMKEKAKRRKNW